MKSKDLGVIIAVAVVAGIFSLIMARLIFATPEGRQQKVEVVQAITTDFTPPDTKYFNANSINPTKLISIGNDTNKTPFNGATQ